MDHSHHDHSAHMAEMDHGGHGGHDMAPMCSMNMLFTWDTKNLCIVFRQWHVYNTTQLILSLIAVLALGIGYEALREGIRQYEAAANKRADTAPIVRGEAIGEEGPVAERSMFRWAGQNKAEVTSRSHLIKSILYGIQNFYAFMIMLIFMTYNGWVMIAVSVGAGVGYFLFGGKTPATKDTACH